MKKICLILILCLIFSLAGCNGNQESNDSNETLLVAAAASLKNCMDEEIIPLFNEKYPNIKINTTYDGSGKLQTQIEEGADVDVFISAAMKQMNFLDEKGFIADGSVVELLENKIVVIVPKDSTIEISSFEDILKSDKIAIGDPDSVPAGQYAKETLENLKIWDEVKTKSSFGTNVTEVLNWVAEGSADAGIVYSTDAASSSNVKVILEAPEGSVSKIIYPAGIINSSQNKEQAKLFVDFLQSDEVLQIFEKYGFTANR